MKATVESGELDLLKKNKEEKDCLCWIKIHEIQIDMDILPDISDSKSANYANETGIGKASPYNIYSYSEVRSIGWTCHFVIQSIKNENSKSAEKIMSNIRLLQSACYPQDDNGYPPPICTLRCGDLLSNEEEGICAILRSYTVKYDTSVPWNTHTDEGVFLPYKVDIDLTFDVAYNALNLPTDTRIFETGY